METDGGEEYDAHEIVNCKQLLFERLKNKAMQIPILTKRLISQAFASTNQALRLSNRINREHLYRFSLRVSHPTAQQR